MLVLIRLANGQRRKFFTSSQELLYQLRYIKEPYNFPFKGVIEAINYGKGTKYRLQTNDDFSDDEDIDDEDSDTGENKNNNKHK